MRRLDELQEKLLNPSVGISYVLREAKVLAREIGSTELQEWADAELSGYEDEESVPSYRRGTTTSFGRFVGSFGRSMSAAPIPTTVLPEEVRGMATDLVMVQGVRALESLLETDGDSFQIPWPVEAAYLLSGKVYDGFECLQAWRAVPRPMVEQVLDSVRTRLLDLVLDLRELEPELARQESATPDDAPDTVRDAVVTNIYGNHNVVASGHRVEQDVGIQGLRPGDIEGLLAFLRGSAGVPHDAAEELRQAIQADGTQEHAGRMGPSVTEWLQKVGEGFRQLSTSTGGSLIAQAIAAYYSA